MFQVFSKPLSGTAVEEPLVTGAYDTEPTSFSPDGRYLVYSQAVPSTRADLWLLELDGARKTRPIINSPSEEREGVVSADGRWLAYQSDESGRMAIYVQAFPDGEERWQVSSGGGTYPRWSGATRELFFMAGERIMAAAVTVAGTEFASSTPSVVLEGSYIDYDVASGGKRLVVVRRAPTAQPLQVRVVLNWAEELRARMARAPGR